MSRIVVAGAGAFGTALALTFERAGRDVSLVGRDVAHMVQTRRNPKLPHMALPAGLDVTDTLDVGAGDILLLAVPTQALSSYLSAHMPSPKVAVACCKGVDLHTGRGPVEIIGDTLGVPAAVLTGPSFAVDLANGLPTALTLAMDHPLGTLVQSQLSTDAMRLYLSHDPIGAQLGGALKNVIAIACGICIGAGLGHSARAALMTRGYAEIVRMALKLGGQPDTLAGLSGFGDLALTCTSPQSRNFSYGQALGGATTTPDVTTEGRATAQAITRLAARHGVDMPIAKAVAGMVEGSITLDDALDQLLSRPLRKE